MTDEEIDKWIAHSRKIIAELEKKMETNYQRGDQSLLNDEYMFLSIWETTKARKPQTLEENRQILIDHGWTIGVKDEKSLTKTETTTKSF